MKTIQQLSGATVLIVLLLSSCRPINETIDQTSLNGSTETETSAFDEPKDPPKDVPKDRDNWKIISDNKSRK